MKKFLILALLLFTFASGYTIHIKSPFTTPNLHIYGSTEFGWWGSATSMASDGNGWYSISPSSTPKTSADPLTIYSAADHSGEVSIGTIASLFTGNPSANDVWVDMTAAGTPVYTDPNVVINPDDPNANARIISAFVRDQPGDGINFENPPSRGGKGMVRDTLSSTGVPIRSDIVDLGSSNLDEWFVTKNDNATCIDMVWERTSDGDWEYDSDNLGTGGFFPIDDFNHLNNSKATLGHNFHFTMEIHLQFEYEKGTAQLFEFRGDDDVWIFVNGILAIDIGGIHGKQDGSVNLDTDQSKLGLVDGETYALDIFFCERQKWGSNFRAKTSIDIKNDIKLFYKEIKISDKETRYDVLKFDFINSDKCGFNINYPQKVDSIPNKAIFNLKGPQFSGEKELVSGLNYGGIEIVDNSSVVINNSDIFGLASGEYTIIFTSLEDENFYGELKFTVETNLILPDTIYLEHGSDTIVEAHGVTITEWSGDSSFTLVNDSVISINPTGNTMYRVIDYVEEEVVNKNADFELPIVSGDYQQRLEADVPGWLTTASDGKIEIWTDGFGGVSSYSGDQFVELNATMVGDLYQDITTVPGTVVSISFAHRGRAGVDVMGLKAGPPDGTYEEIGSYSDSTDKWGFYRENYTVPVGQTETRIFFTSEAYSGSSSGNLLDAITYTKTREIARDSVVVIVEQEEGIALLTASPGDTTYSSDTLDVKLESNPGNTIVYEVFDTASQKISGPDTVTTSVVITITGDRTISAKAFGEGFLETEDSWNYKQDSFGLSIGADPSDADVYYFGESIDTISLFTNFTEGVTIFWSMDTVALADAKLLETGGTLYNRETNFPSILSTSADTLYLSAMAQGDGYETTTATFKYIRQYLPIITATPYDVNGTKFTTDTTVALSVDDPDGRYKNVRIHYTVSTLPDSAVDATYPIDSIIKLDTTRYISAVAFADNAIKSPLFTGLYTEAATVMGAWYKDVSGDGAIDGVKILLSKAVTTLPTSITVTSPFDSLESQVVVATNIVPLSPTELEITLPLPFTFTGETGFEPALLGLIDGAEYIASTFLIDDSLAPVLINADYFTGAVDTLIEKEIVREIDTLVVEFSEDVTIEASPEPFVFTRPGLPYQMFLTRLSSLTESRQVSFLVDSLVGVITPTPGDSLRITPTGIITDGLVAQINILNRWIPLIVHEPPYLLTIRAISPVDPDKYVIPLELQSAKMGKSTGLVMIADFMSQLWNVESLEASVKIFDALGNVVVKTSSFGGEHICVELLTTPRTRIVFIWDGKNSSGRRVGNGAYIAAISITLPNGENIEKRITVGVKVSGL